MIIQIIGYTATILVVISFLFKDYKLRAINSIACLFFITYGYLNNLDIPLIITNIIILIINIKFLISWKDKEN
jgi:hypothetical protein